MVGWEAVVISLSLENGLHIGSLWLGSSDFAEDTLVEA